eukprot:NODE_512_length_6656_cov_0.587006.p7 type:complete len:116 gc:universal NODE_512_length_6656_cov_0.587006:888-541(-)
MVFTCPSVQVVPKPTSLAVQQFDLTFANLSGCTIFICSPIAKLTTAAHSGEVGAINVHCEAHWVLQCKSDVPHQPLVEQQFPSPQIAFPNPAPHLPSLRTGVGVAVFPLGGLPSH